MGDNEKKSILRSGDLHDSIFVGGASAILLSYSLYHHYFDRNTSVWSMSPFLFPVLISIFGLILSLSLWANARRATERGQDSGASARPRRDLRTAVVLTAISIVYCAVMPIVTFIPSTVIYLAVLFFFLGERKIWKIALLSSISTGAIYALFAVGLNVRLP